MNNGLDIFKSSLLSPLNMRDNWSRKFDRLFNEMFEDFLTPLSQEKNTMMSLPRADLAESKDRFLLSVDLPGIKREDLEIEVTGNTVTISGERRSELAGDNAKHVVERSYGRFVRSFQLPEGANVDDLKAQYDHGVLTLTIPKIETARSRKIEIMDGSAEKLAGRQDDRINTRNISQHSESQNREDTSVKRSA